jgi:iron complex transport system substrate-binding protein
VENTLEPTPNPEQIIALQPDLVVIGTFNDPAVIEQLENAGVTLFAINATNIEEVQASILTLGEVVGEMEQAEQMVEAMNDRLAVIDERLIGFNGERPRVLYLSSGGWVAGSQTTVDAIIQRAGGVNIAAQEGLVSWNQVSEETIIELNPDVVILSTYVTDEEFGANPVYAELNAVQNERVYAPSDALMSTTSQYIVLGVEELAKLLYPDLFPAD